MSSNNLNIHPDYDPNLQIKDEPGIVSESSDSASSVIPNLLKTIKNEPGLAGSTRLPSFRVPRDLTLGGNIKLERPKKVYTPNLNAQRIKNREDSNTIKNELTPKGSKGRGREKGKNDRSKDKGKGRGKAASNLVQSSGIFSEGLSDLSTRSRHGSGVSFRDGSGGGKDSSATLEKPKLSIPQKVNKVEEAEKLRELLRDDFIDDGLDVDIENTPVGLPMIHESKLFKNERIESINNIPKKEDVSPTILQNGDAKIDGKTKVFAPQTKVKEAKAPLTVLQVMESTPSTFFLMQVPDCLPGLSQSDDKQNDPRFKKATEPGADNETDKANKFCTLNNLQEGMLGKLQILRCGSARLKLGENDLIIDVGSNLSFRQDLIAAKIKDDKESGDLVNLGLINSILICSPDWENMLKKL